jgi:hypothetical protein
MMKEKTIPSSKVKQVLTSLGLKPVKGKSGGHDIWADLKGRTCRPVLRKKEISLGILYSLGYELENKGIMPRKAFISALKQA